MSAARLIGTRTCAPDLRRLLGTWPVAFLRDPIDRLIGMYNMFFAADTASSEDRAIKHSRYYLSDADLKLLSLAAAEGSTGPKAHAQVAWRFGKWLDWMEGFVRGGRYASARRPTCAPPEWHACTWAARSRTSCRRPPVLSTARRTW